MTEKIGPVQLVAVGFTPDAEFEGRIMDELGRLERHKTIRILDLLFIGKDAETGDLLALDYQGEELGAIVGSLLGFEFEEDGERPDGSSNGIQAHAFGLSQVEMQEMAASLRPGSSAGFLLIEHVWARVSEPLLDLLGARNEVPESSYGVVQEGADELRPFRP